MLIPRIDFGGAGEQIHFAHANGFHPMMYRSLISDLIPNHKVNSKLFRPFWDGSDYRDLKSWHLLADDLIQYLDQLGYNNIIGMGHSMGGVASAIAQAKRPDLFSKLVLIEPVVLQPKYYLFKYMPEYFRKKIVPVAKIALKRKDHWASKEEAFNQLSVKRVFKGVPENVFRDYIEYGTQEAQEGGVKLSYSKEWEAQVYANVTNPWPILKSLKIPVLVIRGAKSNVLADDNWALMKSRLKSFTFKEIEDGGHLVPFEKKSEISKVILDFI